MSYFKAVRLYSLVDQDFCIGDDVLLYTAASPCGPWTRQGTMYTCPEHAAYQQLGYDQVHPYNSKGHPENHFDFKRSRVQCFLYALAGHLAFRWLRGDLDLSHHDC